MWVKERGLVFCLKAVCGRHISVLLWKCLLSGGNQRELARAKNAKKQSESKKGQGAGAKVSLNALYVFKIVLNQY